jgi:hypothetical protein
MRSAVHAAAWSAAKGVPPNRVLLGEFGAYYRVNETPEVRAARLAWIRTIRQAAEPRSFGWAPNEVTGMDLGSSTRSAPKPLRSPSGAPPTRAAENK